MEKERKKAKSVFESGRIAFSRNPLLYHAFPMSLTQLE